MITTLVFDLGGVYFNEDDWGSILRNEYNIPSEESDIFLSQFRAKYALHAKQSEALWRKLGTDNRLAIPGRTIRQTLLNHITPNSAVISLIRLLRKKGYKVAFLSNSHAGVHPYLEKKYKFSKDFDTGLLSHQYSYFKPNKRIYRQMLSKLSAKASEVIYIDDKKQNLHPAREMGMHTIHFKTVEQLKACLHKFGVLI